MPSDPKSLTENRLPLPAVPDARQSRSCKEYLGETLDGRYQVLRLLGEGGMGSVFLAKHAIIGKHLAVKILGCRHVPEKEGIARLFREAQSAAAIGHANIVDVVDVGVSPRGDPYLVMEYLEGEDLSSFVSREGPVSIAAACAIFEPILLALHAAHKKKIVHRDLKPANIYLVQREDGSATVKLIDFGIAKLVGSSDEDKLTMTGALLGTPSYMSPEQAIGVIEVDERADLYAVGVMLYQLVAGRLPFVGANYNEIIFRIVNDEPVAPESIPGICPDAGSVIRKAICKNPLKRFQSAAQLLDALASLDVWPRRAEAFAKLAARIQPRVVASKDVAMAAEIYRRTPQTSDAPRSPTHAVDDQPVSTPVVKFTGSTQQDVVAPTQISAKASEPDGARANVSDGTFESWQRERAVEPTQLSASSSGRIQQPVEPTQLSAPSPTSPSQPVEPTPSLTSPGRFEHPSMVSERFEPGLTPSHPLHSGPLSARGNAALTETRGGIAADAVRESKSPIWPIALSAMLGIAATVALWSATAHQNVAIGQEARDAPAAREGKDTSVLITVNGAPPQATILFADEPMFTNPFRVPSSQHAVALRVEARGFEPYVATVIPAQNSTVSVAMARLDPRGSETPSAAAASPAGASSAQSTISPSGRPLPPKPTDRASAVVAGRRDSDTQPFSSPSPSPSSTSSSAAAIGKTGRESLYTETFE